MIDFLDEIDDEQTDDLLQPEGEGLPDGLYEHFRFVADKGQSLIRVDKFLVDRMMGATRNRIQLAAEAGCVLANNKLPGQAPGRDLHCHGPSATRDGNHSRGYSPEHRL